MDIPGIMMLFFGLIMVLVAAALILKLVYGAFGKQDPLVPSEKRDENDEDNP